MDHAVVVLGFCVAYVTTGYAFLKMALSDQNNLKMSPVRYDRSYKK